MLRQFANPTPRRRPTVSERAVADMVRIDPSAPITPVNDVIPDDVDTPYAINGGGSAKICRQLLGNLRDIEANPGDKNLQAEFLARRDLLRDRMSATDQAMVDGEHARVRELIKPKKRAAPRKQSPPAAA